MRNIQIASRTKYLLRLWNVHVRSLAKLSFVTRLWHLKLLIVICKIYLIFQIAENRFLAIWDTFYRSKPSDSGSNGVKKKGRIQSGRSEVQLNCHLHQNGCFGTINLFGAVFWSSKFEPKWTAMDGPWIKVDDPNDEVDDAIQFCVFQAI